MRSASTRIVTVRGRLEAAHVTPLTRIEWRGRDGAQWKAEAAGHTATGDTIEEACDALAGGSNA